MTNASSLIAHECKPSVRDWLRDLAASAPQPQRDAADGALEAFDAFDLEGANTLLYEAADTGHTSWHVRAVAVAEALADAIDRAEFAFLDELGTDV